MRNETKTRRGTLAASKPHFEQVVPPGASKAREERGSAKPGQMSVVVVKDFAALEACLPAWEKLVDAALEPNVFYEPWMLMPAFRAFGGGKNIQCVLISTLDPARPLGPPILCGFFPLEIQSHYRGLAKKLPIKTLSLWRHPRCYLCTPLLRTEYARECLSAFFDWLGAGTHGCPLMEFGLINGDGPFHQLLIDYLYENPRITCITDRFTRALLRPAPVAEPYVRTAVYSKHRRLRRKEARLAESGRLEYVALGPDANARSWVEDFLRLEASGWKGQEGSAFASNEVDREFFVTIATEAFHRGRLMMLALRFNGRPIAFKCSFFAGPGSFAFRIAFDEEYARFSPGALLELENIRQLNARPGIRWMDSCADPDNPMKNWLWLDRRTIPTMLVGTGRSPGDLVVAVIPLLRWLNRKLFLRKLRS